MRHSSSFRICCGQPTPPRANGGTGHPSQEGIRRSHPLLGGVDAIPRLRERGRGGFPAYPSRNPEMPTAMLQRKVGLALGGASV